MKTLSEIAGDGYRGMEYANRYDGKRFVRVSDNAPAWLRDGILEIHATDILPDDWRFEVIRDALGALADADLDEPRDADRSDVLSEIADGAVDIYNDDRIAWLGSHMLRAGYADEAAAELGTPETGILDRIALGQYREAEEIAARVLAAVSAAFDAASAEAAFGADAS